MRLLRLTHVKVLDSDSVESAALEAKVGDLSGYIMNDAAGG